MKDPIRKCLKELSDAVEKSVRALDAEMKKPSDSERGGRIAKITNFLELNNDLAKRYGLGVKFKGEK